MSSARVGRKRKDLDVVNLIEEKYEVITMSDIDTFLVKFHGPIGTPYEGGIWNVRVFLPENYPFKSPSIGFMTKIFHPNIDEKSGTVCLDVINQKWTALYDLKNVFQIFLPQLLTHPNPTDPLNAEAASLYMHRPEDFRKKVIEFVRTYATDQAMIVNGIDIKDTSDSESSISDFGDERD